MEVSKLVELLRKGNIGPAITMVRAWLSVAPPGAPEALLAECPTDIRGRMALLLRDLISRYPSTVVGAPVLLYWRKEDDGPNQAKLPFPSQQDLQPCHDLHFLGWLPLTAQLPIALPFRPESYSAMLTTTEGPQAFVALFRSHPGVFDLDSIELPNMWWGELFFRSTPGTVHLSSQSLLAYPDALEAARVLQAAARGLEPPARIGFLSDNAWAWAMDSGALFQESCRHWATEAAQ